MRRHMYLSFPPRKIAEPRIPLRWKLFIVFSTATFLGLAAIIAFWLPDYRPIAWALVLFSACHVTFLIVQRVGSESGHRDSSGDHHDGGEAEPDLWGDR